MDLEQDMQGFNLRMAARLHRHIKVDLFNKNMCLISIILVSIIWWQFGEEVSSYR